MWKFRSGVAWRDVPVRYGFRATLRTRLRRWAKNSLFTRILRRPVLGRSSRVRHLAHVHTTTSSNKGYE
ncbi:transposase [Streptomyces justiciae]|uniref:transposase n=1 Tax=Streptomyces justiciae TaxID=2780140 RepID=UPI003908887F